MTDAPGSPDRRRDGGGDGVGAVRPADVNGLPVRKGEYRILDFDIENRPLTYWVPERPTAEVTAIAACWVDRPSSMRVWLLGRDDPRTMLDEFAAMYAVADMVTGHFIRKHDLRILQGAMAEFGLPPLGPKLAQDTKLDLIGFGDLPQTQEYLSEMLGIDAEKVHMTQAAWREANRLTETGLAKTQDRVVGDVLQHMAMREALLARGLLRKPKEWKG